MSQTVACLITKFNKEFYKMSSNKNIFAACLLLISALIYAGTTQQPIKADQTTTAQWCKGVNIVFFPGGTPGGAFESVVYNGALQATADLGPTTQYVWSDWSPDKMITQFKQAEATHPDGIAIMGHPGDDAFKPVVDEAEKAGIIVTHQNSGLPKLEGTYKATGFGYVGADLYPQGQSVGNEAIQRFGLKKGDRVMLWGLLSQAGRGQRTKGVKDALEAAGVTVDYLEIDDATQKDVTAGIPTFTGYVSAHPDVKAVITDHGNLTATLPSLLKAAGKKAGDIKAGGFDANAATIKGIQDGWIDFTNDQQEWLQGYMPILQICLTKKYGFSGLHVDTGAGFITKDNVSSVAALAGSIR
jgi:simple sugar transport system substrate-binding protein